MIAVKVLVCELHVEQLARNWQIASGYKKYTHEFGAAFTVTFF